MTALLLYLFNRSIAASLLILAVLVLRVLFRRLPKDPQCLLWIPVGLLLILPVSIRSPVGLAPAENPITRETVTQGADFVLQRGVTQIRPAEISQTAEISAAAMKRSGNALQILSVIWLVGLAAMVLYGLVSYCLLRKKLAVCLPCGPGIYLCDSIPSPFVLGLFRPKVYLPSTLSPQTMDFVLAHELAHIRHRDPWWKLLGFALLSVYWFHPLVWLSYWLFCRDLEIACDERATQHMAPSEKRDYTACLLACAAPKEHFPVCPVAFSQNSVRQRVRAVLRKKTTKGWVLFAACVCAIAAIVCFATAPRQPDNAVSAEGYHLEADGENDLSLMKDGQVFGGVRCAKVFGKESDQEIFRLVGIDLNASEYSHFYGSGWSLRTEDGRESYHSFRVENGVVYDLYYDTTVREPDLRTILAQLFDALPTLPEPGVDASREADQAALACFTAYLDACTQESFDTWAQYVYFSNDTLRAEAKDGYAPIQNPELVSWERVNDRLWAFTWQDPALEHQSYSFVALMNGTYRILRNVNEIPSAYMENVPIYSYSETRSEWAQENDLAWIFYELRSFATPDKVECFGLEQIVSDPQPMSFLNFSGSINSWHIPEEIPETARDADDISVGCRITSFEGYQMVIRSDEEGMALYDPEGDQTYQILGWPGAKILSSIKDWALAQEQDGSSVFNAASVLVCDADTEQVFYCQNLTQAISPGKWGKLALALAVVREVPDPEHTVVNVHAPAHQPVPIFSEEVLQGLTVQDHLYRMLLQGEDDSTYALAVSVFGSTRNALEEMNAWAQRICYDEALFTDLYGQDENQFITISGLRSLLLQALKNPILKEIWQSSGYTVPSTGEFVFSRNFLLVGNSGVVRGITPDSRVTGGFASCVGGLGDIAVTAAYDGRNLLCIVLGAPRLTHLSEADDPNSLAIVDYWGNYEEMEKLLDKAF